MIPTPTVCVLLDNPAIESGQTSVRIPRSKAKGFCFCFFREKKKETNRHKPHGLHAGVSGVEMWFSGAAVGSPRLATVSGLRRPLLATGQKLIQNAVVAFVELSPAQPFLSPPHVGPAGSHRRPPLPSLHARTQERMRPSRVENTISQGNQTVVSSPWLLRRSPPPPLRPPKRSSLASPTLVSQRMASGRSSARPLEGVAWRRGTRTAFFWRALAFRLKKSTTPKIQKFTSVGN